MASNKPRNKPEMRAFAQSHASQWVAQAAEIGVAPAQATAFADLCAAFETSSESVVVTRQESKNATTRNNDDYQAVSALCGALINQIKAFAQATNDPNVYVIAGLSPDAPPSQSPAPLAPKELTATLIPDGTLLLKWKVTQPAGLSGVQYRVFRKLVGEDTFALIGTAGGKKTFTDATIPFGADGVTYQIVPWRGDVTGAPSNAFEFRFGAAGGPGLGAVRFAA